MPTEPGGWSYKPMACRREGHGQSLFCVAFNHRDPSLGNVFATVGGNRATLYRCEEDNSLTVLHCFTDQNVDEEFFVCTWSLHRDTGAPLLLIGGKNGMVHVLNCQTGTLELTLKGHGSSVNDIAVHPRRPELVATASKDQTLRLWNLVNGRPILLCQGDGGHSNEVLTLDWKIVGSEYSLVSAGMDSYIKIWELSKYAAKMDECISWSDPDREFPLVHVYYPAFSAQVHGNYVDCARWLGELVISKSVDNKLLFWLPELEGYDARSFQEGRYTIVQEMQLDDCEGVWWVRFGMDSRFSRLVLGNRRGATMLFDLLTPPPRTASKPRAAMAKLYPLGPWNSSQPRMLVRQAALSSCGTWIAAAHDGGNLSVYRQASQKGSA